MKKFKEKNNNRLICSDYLLDHDCDLYVEDYFQEALTLERKRTGRSRKPFLLMLINIHNLIRNDGKKQNVERLARVLHSSTRETDIKGWYKYGDVIGIIFTEINEEDKDLIKVKIINSFSDILGMEKVKMIKISCHLFPEESDREKTDKTETDSKLYPDLSKQKFSERVLRFLKRTMDIAGSIFGILIFSPFFIIIPILIKLTSQGPVFFKQERLGQFGKRFTFLKFRSMNVNCDDLIHKRYIKDLIRDQKSIEGDDNDGEKGYVYKIKDDSRITPIGRFLRKSSLDELPQFFNVLKGDMSLVGPRPPIPYELEHYDIWHKRRILEIKPGITGIWQIRGRSSTTFDEMVRMDIQYIREWSLFLDIKILLKTPLVVLRGKGAY